MKKLITSSYFVFFALYTIAQVPQKINYQAVARYSSGTTMASQPLGVKINIHKTSASGTNY